VHFPASIAFLVAVYVRAERLVPHVRYLFVTVTSAALLIHLAFPLAPPRMPPGYVDTIARYGLGDLREVRGRVGRQPVHGHAVAPLRPGGAGGLRRRAGAAQPVAVLAVLHPAITLVAIVLRSCRVCLPSAIVVWPASAGEAVSWLMPLDLGRH
jgi:hypothetical protein